MTKRFLVLLRQLSLTLALAFTAAAVCTVPSSVAHADDDWDDDEDEDKDDDEDDYEDDEEEEEEEGYDQPPYTAGGLFTKKTWPKSYVERNLILIGGMAEVRAGLDIDMSNQTAFEVWRTVLSARYGVFDYFELHAGANFVTVGEISPTTASGLFNALFYAGFESAIAFELVNFRVTTELLYTELNDGDLAFDIAFGFPFRYRFNDKVAIYALERLMTIQTSDSPGNESKPDFTLGVSAAFQPISELAIIGGARVNVADFNFEDNAITIPAHVGVLFAPSNKFDLGLQFTLLNLKPADENVEFYDFRSLQLFAQLRL